MRQIAFEQLAHMLGERYPPLLLLAPPHANPGCALSHLSILQLDRGDFTCAHTCVRQQLNNQPIAEVAGTVSSLQQLADDILVQNSGWTRRLAHGTQKIGRASCRERAKV